MEELAGLHGYSNPLVREEPKGARGWQCELPAALGTMWYWYVGCLLDLFGKEGVKELTRTGRAGTPSSSFGLLLGQRRGCLLIHPLLLAGVVLY